MTESFGGSEIPKRGNLAPFRHQNEKKRKKSASISVSVIVRVYYMRHDETRITI